MRLQFSQNIMAAKTDKQYDDNDKCENYWLTDIARDDRSIVTSITIVYLG